MNAYLMIDTTAKKSNPSFGFCNTKIAIAFESKELRESFLDARANWDLSAKNITRNQAMKMLKTIPCSQDKGLPLNQEEICENYIVLRESAY